MERNNYEQTEKQSSGFRPSSRLSVEAFDLLAQFPKPVNVATAASFSDSESLCFSSIYTGMIGADLRPQDVAHEDGEQQLEGAKALRPSEVTRREAQFTDENKQGDWTKATEQNRLSKRQSATHECLTDEQIADLERRGLGQKFEITGLTQGNGSAEDTGTVIDYKPQEVAKNKSFALGMDYEEGRDTRSVYQKMTDFARAAGKRAADPEGWKSYIQGELDKMIGVGEGLNIAKESTKGAVVAGWNALTDGTVANFLAKPNAINDPLFHAVGGALTAMTEDPNAVNHALERVGTTIMNASERYSALPNREKGHVIGETMFAMVNPEGSTEGGELALKIADGVATHVDATVMRAIQQSLKAAEEAAKTSPEVAQEMKQMLQNYLSDKGLTAPELEYAGVPKGYFDGLEAPKPDDHVLFMKGDKGLPQGVKPSEQVLTQRELAPSGEAIHTLEVPEEVFKAAEARGIDRITVQERLDKIATAVTETYTRLGDYSAAVHGSERAYGNKFHEMLRQKLGVDPLLHTESSYLKGAQASWGKLGTSRVDIALGEQDKPFASLCLKTLRAVPSAQQERGWVRNLPRLADDAIIPRIYFKLGK